MYQQYYQANFLHAQIFKIESINFRCFRKSLGSVESGKINQTITCDFVDTLIKNRPII